MTPEERLDHFNYNEARRRRMSLRMVEALWAIKFDRPERFRVRAGTRGALCERRLVELGVGEAWLTDEGRAACDALFGKDPPPEYYPGYMQGRGAA